MKKKLLFFIIIISIEMSANSNINQLYDDFLKFSRQVMDVQRTLVDSHEYIPQRCMTTYSSVYEVSIQMYNSLYLIVHSEQFYYIIDAKKKKNYYKIISSDIDNAVQGCNLTVQRLDQIASFQINHPGLKRSVKKLTDICLSVQEKYK